MKNDKKSLIRPYLFEVSKIVEGSLNGDLEKVRAYATRLAEMLDKHGEHGAANRVKEIIGSSKAHNLGFAGFGGNGYAEELSAPVDSESDLNIADIEHFAQGEIQVFLPQKIEKEIERFISYYLQSDKLVANGIPVSLSMLLFGPPGCGKSQVARFIAQELELPLIVARTDGLVSSLLGSTAKNIRKLFEFAAAHPCVLFLDEFDAIGKMRDDQAELGELKRVVISLLQNIDSLGQDRLLLAATNHEHLLDPAIWRRFDFVVNLTEPDEDARRRMIIDFLGDYKESELVEVLVPLSKGLSGAQIETISKELVRRAILENTTGINLMLAIRAFADARNRNFTSKEPTLKEQMTDLREYSPKFFTQTKLAKVFGISQSQVSKILKETN